MSYPPETRSSHEADGRSDRSGGSGGAHSSSGTAAGGSASIPKWRSHDNYPEATASDSGRLLHLHYKNWILGMDYLLRDGEGVALFKAYLQSENCSNLLDFWFACQGFKSKVDPSDKHKITQLIKAIYRTYIRGTGASAPAILTNPQSATGHHRTDPIRLRTETRRQITERISRKHALDQTIFDAAQNEVEQFLRTTAYPSFLKSDIYIEFLQSTSTYPYGASPGRSNLAGPHISGLDVTLNPVSALQDCSSTSHPLPTLDEDRELKSEEIATIDLVSRSRPGPSQIYDVNYPVYPGHCQHCSQCCPGPMHPCTAGSPHPGWRPPGSGVWPPPATPTPAAPLTMENLQMTRLYRAELSVHQAYTNEFPSRPGQENQPANEKDRRTTKHTQPHHRTGQQCHPGYAYTRWPGDLYPHQHRPDAHSIHRLLGPPPNPYHTSYAPVSARDSERHSLSSDARTEDTHSHTDSSHDGGMNRRLLQCSFGPRYPPGHRFPTSPSCRKQAQSGTGANQNLYHHQYRMYHQNEFNASQADSALVSGLVSPPKSRASALRQSAESNPGVEQPNGSGKLHGKYQRRSARRHSTNRGGEKAVTRPTAGENVGEAAGKTPHNLAERDPQAFHQLICAKLQRVLDEQIASDRLDRLIADQTIPVPAESSNTTLAPPCLASDKNPAQVIGRPNTDQLAPIAAKPVASKSSLLLQRPWVDKLLAAARVQQAEENAQSILEDHCSRIWAASADRTPTSSDGSNGNGGPEHGRVETKCTNLVDTVHQPQLLDKFQCPVSIHRYLGGEEGMRRGRCGGDKLVRRPDQQMTDSPTSASPAASLSASSSSTSSKKRHDPTIAVPQYTAVTTAVTTSSVIVSTAGVSGTPSVTVGSLDISTSVGALLPSLPSTNTTSSSVASNSVPHSSGSGASASGLPGASSSSLVIGYYFGDDPVPYRSLWPSSEITLGQFKLLIPRKKGQFRFFFKKASNEFDSGVVHQEITNDETLLPLWEGKVVAKVERID